MLAGYPPFASEDDAETIELIRASEVVFEEDAWGQISDSAKDLIMQIFQNEKNRPSAKKVLSHPWVKSFADSSENGSLLEVQLKRLKEFQNKTKFRKAVLSYLSSKVTDRDVANEK